MSRFTPPMLTHREREVLKLFARGRKSADIANQLEVSLYTIENDHKNILRKTGISNNSMELMLYAVQNGIFLSE